MPTPEPACRFTLPCPPSTNNLFRNVPGKGRVRTAAYKAWINEAGWLIKSQRPAAVPGRVAMLIDGIARLDLDNIKAIPDLIKKLGLIGDDGLIDDLRVRRGAGGEVTVSIWPMAAVADAQRIVAPDQLPTQFVERP